MGCQCPVSYMEAAITDDQHDLPPHVARLFTELRDPRMARAAVLKAEGGGRRSWKEVSAELGLDADGSTLRRWRAEHPIDELAMLLAREVVREGALDLAAAFGTAVKVQIEIMNDVTARPSDRLKASSEIIRCAVKAAQLSAGSASPNEPDKDPLDDLGDTELAEFVRKSRALGSGKGGR